MSELRQNPITKQWVLIAPKRSKRPEDFKSAVEHEDLPELDRACVFCPGNESLNPDLCDDVCRVPNNGKWEVRVIKNKFEALEKTAVYRHKEFYTSRSGYGEHEIVINRRHNEPVALQPLKTIDATLQTFIERINAMKADPNLAYVQVFHNHKHESGATVVHPHYQILATPIVPPDIHSEMLNASHYYHAEKSCVYCNVVAEEIEVKDRLVYQDKNYAVIAPYASERPFQINIYPKTHRARFEDISQEEIKGLSVVLKMVLGQMYNKLNDPALNFYIHTLPIHPGPQAMNEERSSHWHLTILPRTNIWGGFEYATGIPIVPVSPEVAAKFLKGE